MLEKMMKDEVMKSILRYILKRPDAADTLEGITEWWIMIERIETKTQEVADAVAELSAKGILLEKNLGGAVTLYTVNRKKLQTIVGFLNDLES